ncbi:MAG: RsmB/NOP family class I SAM-dependent RNA methyltransferase [Trueperaceae bacterium]|nr:RsmB/NOP family class I SAM-dependent RNA methyltransferase [Trueperaceae bacterium]
MNDRPALPDSFRHRMRQLLGADADTLLAALAEPPVVGLRVNTLKLSPDAFASRCRWTLRPVPWCTAGFVVEDSRGEQPGRHPDHDAGLYYLQDPSAMAVAEAAGVQPGDWTLDLAAAPGGKATHLAANLAGDGLLIANDVHPGRSRALLSNLERIGTHNAVVTSDEVGTLARRWGATFDRVLLDAPCSGEGMFRKSDDARNMWREETVTGSAKRQQGLLAEAALLVRPGGTLVYSTCTFAPEENEAVVARFLETHDEFEVDPLTLPHAAPGRPDWLPKHMRHSDLVYTARFWPHRVRGEGHFVAKLRHRQRAEPTDAHLGAGLTVWRPVPPAVEQAWREFADEALTHDPFAEGELTMFGNKLHAVPEEVPTLAGVKALRSGVWLGNTGRGKSGAFEPSHSLASALSADTFQNRLDLPRNHPDLVRYLRGEPLEHPGSDGWVMVCTDGFGLGWARRRKDRLKNAYPKGLRWTG